MPTRMLAPCRAALLLGLVAASAMAKEPKLDRLFPAGGQRGQTVEVQAEGTFDPWPPRVWVSGPGLKVEPGSKPGQLSVKIADDAPTGLVGVRLHNAEGASALRPFLIGTIREVNETEPNNDPTQPQTIEPGAVTINGRLEKAGDVDGFAVALKAGETLVVSMTANEELGSPMDGVLQIATPEGFVLVHEDDDNGLDPFLIFQAPTDGTYIVRTFAFPATPTSSIQFAGGADFIYRLTITNGGFLDYPAPLAISRESSEPVEVHGWNLSEETRRISPVREDASRNLARVGHPSLANQAEIPIVAYPTLLESGPSSADTPQAIALPVSITGRIDPEGDADVYQWSARKDEEFLFRVHSRSLGFPLDPILRVLDASGKVVSEADDSSRDVRDVELRFKAPADGDYRVLVRDLNGRGGPRHVYRLDALVPTPDYRLTVATDRFTLGAEKPLEIPVTIHLENGFEGEVLLEVEGLPAGIIAEPLKAADTPPPKDRRDRTVTLTLRGDSPDGWSGPIRILGHLNDAERERHSATFSLGAGLDARIDQGWLTILPTQKETPDKAPAEAPSEKKP